MKKKSLSLPSYAIILALANLIMLFFTLNLAFGEEHILSEQEIKATLSGHEIKGIWSGKNYTQTFNEDGSTIYKQENESSWSGMWSIKEGKFCSNFGGSENCYQIIRKGNSLFWIYTNGEHRAFTVVK